jgi:hypothetical protein
MNQDNGGIIGKLNTPTTTVASGVWTLQDQFEAQSSSIWPLAFPQTTIANSCRFDDGSSDYLSQTISSSTGKTFTLSFWMKKSTDNSSMGLFHLSSDNNGNHYIEIATKSGNGLDMQFKNGTSGTNATFLRRKTNRLFRDFSAWMNVVIRFDSTQASASDRFRLYINGVQETSLDVDSTPDVPQDYVTDLNTNGSTLNIGRLVTGSAYYDGYFAEMILADGSSLGPTSFGAFNPVTNIWEPRGYAGTYGTNGFRLDFANSSALGNDVSGNDNDFTANNLTSVDQSTDTCSNNFETWNPLTTLKGNNSSLSNGNTTLTDTGTTDTDGRNYSTIGASSGKWYFEIKASAFSNNNHTLGVSFSDGDVDSNSNDSVRVRYTTSNNTNYIRSFGTTVQSNLTSFSAGSIIGVAVDLDNGTLQFYVNGSTYGSQLTGLSGSIANRTMFVQSYGEGGSGRTFTLDANFGNPPFSISSGNSDANGFGNFEYAVPSGYYALCTKNLAEFG